MSLQTALHSVLVDRELPYSMNLALQKALRTAGSKERTVTSHGLQFRVRRLTCDEDFVRLVVAEREYLRHGIVIRSGDAVVDVGGNIGCFAVLAASLGARVIAAEPEAENLRLLRRNVALNAVNVEVLPVAVAGERGTISFWTAPEGGYHTIVVGRRKDAVEQRVPAVPLMDILPEQCDLLKMDCEGAEFAILEALPAEGFARIRQVAMEYHYDPARREEQTQWLVERFAQHGFRLLHHEPFPRNPGGHLFLAKPTVR